MENFLEKIEFETLPALEIVHKSLRDFDDTHGQRVLLQGIIDRLRGQCEAAQKTVN